MREEGTGKINIEYIMQEIREDILQRGIIRDDELFSATEYPFELEDAKGTIGHLRNISTVAVYRPIESRPGFAGKVITFFKRAVRKCVAFMLVPMAQEETRFNHMTSDCIGAIYSAQLAADERIRILEQEIASLKRKLKS